MGFPQIFFQVRFFLLFHRFHDGKFGQQDNAVFSSTEPIFRATIGQAVSVY